ncbi:STP13 [Scenedesmus sp. PABB004]|nr:STP13 [Scenedesmus sp. PABB004]
MALARITPFRAGTALSSSRPSPPPRSPERAAPPRAAAAGFEGCAAPLGRDIKVVGCGSCGVDYLASIAAFPAPDQKLRTDALEVQGGGNCANALTAAARLGLRPAIVTKIGGDGLGDGIISELQADGVDASLVLRAAGHPSPFTYIIVDRAGGTRTCIHTPGAAMAPGEMAPALVAAALDGAALVYFDGRLTEAALLLARAARAAGVPVLVEGERLRPGLQDLLQEADYVVTSAHFPQEWTGEACIGDAMLEVAARLPNARMVITTRGTQGSICLLRAAEQEAAGEACLQELLDSLGGQLGEPRSDRAVCVSSGGVPVAPARVAEAPAPLRLRFTPGRDASAAEAFAREAAARAAALNADAGNSQGYTMVQQAPAAPAASGLAARVLVASAAGLPPGAVADTTGAGDAFIGSVLYGLATGLPPAQLLSLGAAVAACKCTALGARPGLPRRAQLAAELLAARLAALAALIAAAPLLAASTAQESFVEEALVSPLLDGLQLVHLQFELSAPARRHYALFPKAVGQLVAALPFDEVELSLTQGRWQYQRWGQPLLQAKPAGAELRAAFSPLLPPDGVAAAWSALSQALGGLFCASLNFVARPEATAARAIEMAPPDAAACNASAAACGWQPAAAGRQVLYAALPQEGSCTENLTPWLKLLPCRDVAGLGKLLADRSVVFGADYHSLRVAISVQRDEEQRPLHTTLTQTLTLALRPHAPGGGGARLAPRPGALADLKLGALLGSRLDGACPLAQQSRLVVKLPGEVRGDAAEGAASSLLRIPAWEEEAEPAQGGGDAGDAVDGSNSDGDGDARQQQRASRAARRRRRAASWQHPAFTLRPVPDAVAALPTAAGGTAVAYVYELAGAADPLPPVSLRWARDGGGGDGGGVIGGLPAAPPAPAAAAALFAAAAPAYAVTRYITGTGNLHGGAVLQLTRQAPPPDAGDGRANVSVCVFQVVPWHVRLWLHTLQLSIDGQPADLGRHLTHRHISPAADRAAPLVLDLCLALPARARSVALTATFSKAFLTAFEHPPDAHRGFDVPAADVALGGGAPGAGGAAARWRVAPASGAPPGAGAGGPHGAGSPSSARSRRRGRSRRVPACAAPAPRAPLRARRRGRRRRAPSATRVPSAHPPGRDSSPPQVYSPGLVVPLAVPDFSMPYNVICLTSTVLAVFLGATLNTLLLRPRELEDASGGGGGAAAAAAAARRRRAKLLVVAGVQFTRTSARATAAMAGGAIVAGPGGRSTDYSRGRITPYVVMACFVGACTGLVFGYDIGIAGGVISYPDFQARFFPQARAPRPPRVRAVRTPRGAQLKVLEKHADKNAFCKYNDPLLQLFVSVLFLAGIVGAFVGSFTSKRLGRRPTMMLGGGFFLLGAILMAPAVHVAMLIVGRVAMGLGVGICVQCGPLFLSELAPYHLRGAFNTQFQLFITIGILAAQLINYGNQNYEWGWRLNLGLAGLPALLLIVGAALVPETPNHLVERGQLERGRATLRKIRGVDDVEAELDDMRDAADAAHAVRANPWRAMFSRKFTPQLVILVALQIFNQLDGINSIMFYAPQLFDAMGSGRREALLTHVIIGAVNVATTFVAVFTVDRLGRTFWMIEASAHMMVCEIIVGVLVATQMDPLTGALSRPVTIGLIVVVCVFIAGHAWGWGPMPWLVCSEVQPLHTRAAGTGLATIVNFALTFVIGQCFLSMLCAMRYGVFFFFAGWLAFMGVFTYLLVPETKGVPIEAIEDKFRGHWFWSRVMARNDARADRASRAAAAPAHVLEGDDDVCPDRDTVCRVTPAGGGAVK